MSLPVELPPFVLLPFFFKRTLSSSLSLYWFASCDRGLSCFLFFIVVALDIAFCRPKKERTVRFARVCTVLAAGSLCACMSGVFICIVHIFVRLFVFVVYASRFAVVQSSV